MPVFTIELDREILVLAMERGESVDIRLKLPLTAETELPLATSPRPRGPLARLIEAGLLVIGETLTFHQSRANRTAEAVVRPDGSLEVVGKTGAFWSPSKAAGAITGSQINGWTAWRRKSDGRSLDDLRTLLDERDV